MNLKFFIQTAYAKTAAQYRLDFFFGNNAFGYKL